jgi:hypothetical protein
MKTIRTDLDLPPALRTQANLWKAKYFELRRELVAVNKGARKLRHRLNRLKEKLPNKKSIFIDINKEKPR